LTPPRYFEDLEVGQTFRTPARTLTEADLVAFAAISGAHEALDRSRAVGEPPPAVPELLVLTVTSGLGFRIPAPAPQVLAFMTFDSRFLAPVRIGDTLHCRVRIAGKRALKGGGVVVEAREMVNQRGEIVQESEYKVLVARRPTSPTP
jgi:acyl dehydratase